MSPFATIEKRAAERVGGMDELAAKLPEPASAADLRSVGDDRYLSQMSLRVFRAGLRHALVDKRWPAFEKVFMGFEPRRVRAMSDEALEGLMKDERLIRHWGKIKSVRANAAAMLEVAEAFGGFGGYLADWPDTDTTGLWADLSKRFQQLGGHSGPYLLRMVGKDTFLLTGDVVRALNHWKAFDGTPKGKRDRAQVQDAFNRWRAETNRPHCQLSRILALSID